jgi:hypothetical protein
MVSIILVGSAKIKKSGIRFVVSALSFSETSQSCTAGLERCYRRREILLPFELVERLAGVRRLPFPHVATGLVAFFLVVAAFNGMAANAAGALAKPSYTAGDRWVYVLTGSLNSLPGLNANRTGTFHFDLVGRAEVNVLGPSSVLSGSVVIPAVAVDTSASGFLNGTFAIPNLGTARVTGSFTTRTSEMWEDRAYLPIRSNTTTSYVADVTFLITTTLTAMIRANASVSAATIPPFDLEVGQNASAALQTHLLVNSTVTVAGRTQSSENRTDLSSVWRREVLSRDRITVDAGTFTAYKLNQTGGSFPGIGGISGRANETAYFSNETGYYVKRDAYANGTRVAEMRLKSYSYGARTSGFGLVDWLLILAAVAVGLVLVLAYLRRRKKRIPQAPSGGSPPTTVEMKGGGKDDTH